MAITSTQSMHPASIRNVAVGSYISSDEAAAFKITTGFKPRYVRIVNETSGDQMEWFEGMADAEGIVRIAAGTCSIVTELGVTVAVDGFTLGLSLTLNVTDEQLSWLALG